MAVRPPVVVSLDGGPPSWGPGACGAADGAGPPSTERGLEPARRLAREGVEAIHRRLISEVAALARRLEESLEAQLGELQGRVGGELRSENEALRRRLAAAEAVLLRLPLPGAGGGGGTAASLPHLLTSALPPMPAARKLPSADWGWPSKEEAALPKVSLSRSSSPGGRVTINCDGEDMASSQAGGEHSGGGAGGVRPTPSEAVLCMRTDAQESQGSHVHFLEDGGRVMQTATSFSAAGEQASQQKGRPRGPLRRGTKALNGQASSTWGPRLSAFTATVSEVAPSTGCLKRFITSRRFEGLICICILLNCASTGIQAHGQVADGYGPAFTLLLEVSEHIFTAVFTIEFLMKWQVYGWRGFCPTSAERRANLMDAMVLLFTGILFTWLLPAVTAAAGVDRDQPTLRMLTVLRAMRLARLVRVFQKVKLFREAGMLIRGMADSARTLFWTCVMIFFVTYVFAIFGLVTVVDALQQYEAAATDAAQIAEIAGLLRILAGIDRLMYTLVQVLLGDSFHAFMRPIMFYVPWSWVYFYAYISVACFVLMNLVTAIIVDHAVSSSASDHENAVQQKEAKKHKELKELKKLFTLMDADRSGTLSWDEFKESFDDEEMSKKWMLLDFQAEDCKELFALLDDGGHGEIEINEFFTGLGRMQGNAQSKDVFRLQKSIYKLLGSVDELMAKPSEPKLRTLRSRLRKAPGQKPELPAQRASSEPAQAAARLLALPGPAEPQPQPAPREPALPRFLGEELPA